MWPEISEIAASVSALISIVALFVARSASETSSKIASEALKTARQANEIALGLKRESPILEIYSSKDIIDLTKETDFFSRDFDAILGVINTGNTSIDGLLIECIGIKPLTYSLSDSEKIIKNLPSETFDIKLSTMILPSGLINIDINYVIARYLSELCLDILDDDVYTTTINIVLIPKAVGDKLPSGVLSTDRKEDRKLLKLFFTKSITETEEFKKIVQIKNIKHRVYTP